MLRGLKDNETRMQAIGFTPYLYRLTAYVIAGTLCGLAGFLLGNQAEFVSPAYMHWQRSGELIIMVLLGGTGTLYGPMLGALAFLRAGGSPVAADGALEGPSRAGARADGAVRQRRDRRCHRRLPPTAGTAVRRGCALTLAGWSATCSAPSSGASARWAARRILVRPAQLFRLGGQETLAPAREAGKMALGRGPRGLPSLAERGFKTSLARWWRQ